MFFVLHHSYLLHVYKHTNACSVDSKMLSLPKLSVPIKRDCFISFLWLRVYAVP